MASEGMAWISKTSKEYDILALAPPNVAFALLAFLRLIYKPYLCSAKIEELELVSLFFRLASCFFPFVQFAMERPLLGRVAIPHCIFISTIQCKHGSIVSPPFSVAYHLLFISLAVQEWPWLQC